MRRLSRWFVLSMLLLPLGACSLRSSIVEEEALPQDVPEADVFISEEVSYRGVLKPVEETFSSEGTHRLLLGEGQYLLLRSDVADLEEYEDQEIRVTGTVRQTVDGDADIMRVSRVEAIIGASVSSVFSSEESSSSSEETEEAVAVSSAAASEESSVSAASSSVPASSARSSAVASLPPPPTSSSRAPLTEPSAEPSSAAVAGMAKAGTDPGEWTQQYCSSHIGFCVPVHKNWWFKSFGTTASTLWHVEMSGSEITQMGEGPIAVDFESGTLPSGMTDGAVSEAGGRVTGYRSWTGNRHFRISADAALKGAVSYMTANLTTYEPPSP